MPHMSLAPVSNRLHSHASRRRISRFAAAAREPAIRLAEEGFVVTATLAEDLAGATGLNPAGQDL